MGTVNLNTNKSDDKAKDLLSALLSATLSCLTEQLSKIIFIRCPNLFFKQNDLKTISC